MRFRTVAAFVAGLAMLAIGAAPASAGVVVYPSISQVFTTGGETDAQVENDFVELKNRLIDSPLVINNGMSLQSATATGTTWEVTLLPNTIPTNGFYLVGLDSNGTEGVALPTPDATATTVDLQPTGGKVALVAGTTPLMGACPNFTTSAIVDFVGWGNANCSEGTVEDEFVGALSSASRADFGCTDTNDNDNDFNQFNPFEVHNSASTAYSCANDAPVLAPIDDKVVDEGSQLFFIVDYTDPDGDPVTLSASNLPPGATFNGAAFEWTPTCSQAGTYPGVHFVASDPENATDTDDVTITVNEVCTVVDTTTTLTVAKKGKKKLLASGGVAPPQPGGEVSVTLFRKRHGEFKRKAHDAAALTGGSGYQAVLRRPKKGRCRVVAEFPGEADAEPSSAVDTFRCRKP